MSDVLLLAGRCSPFAGIRDEACVGLFIPLSLHCQRDTLTEVSLIPMGWLSEQTGRDPAFHSKNDAPSPAWAAVSMGGIYSSPAHLPLPCNPLNPLTTGLDYCQLCRASVANGVSCLLLSCNNKSTSQIWAFGTSSNDPTKQNKHSSIY